MKNEEKQLAFFTILIPILSIIIFSIVAFFLVEKSFKREQALKIEAIKDKYIQDNKDILKNRLQFLETILNSHDNSPKSNLHMLEVIDNLNKNSENLICIYEVIDLNSYTNFAKKILGKEDFNIAPEGFVFGKKEIEEIRQKGETFVSCCLEQLNPKIHNEKISHYRYNKKFNWILSTNFYLDKMQEGIESEIEKLTKAKRERQIRTGLLFLGLLLFSILLSLLLRKKILDIFDKYKFNLLEKDQEIMTSLDEKKKELEEQLFVDELTALKSRKALVRDLENFEHPKLCIVDIDSFRQINNYYGAEFGDYVLVEFGRFLKDFGEEYEFETYRLQGDEFALLKNSIYDIEELEEVVFALTKKLEDLKVKNQKLNIEISIDATIGMSFEEEDTLKKAYIALGRASNERRPFLAYSEFISAKRDDEKEIELSKALKDAIKEDKITPYYQPILDSSNKIIKYECLGRVDVDGEVTSIVHFLDTAKKTKQYPHISRVLIRKALQKFKNQNIELSINVSTIDIENKDFAGFLIDEIEENNLCGNVTIEILESESITNMPLVQNFIAQMKKYGTKIAIDDFGSGYANFSYVLELKPDFIKIDGSLIKNIDTNESSKILVKTIAEFSKALGIKTVAEYIHSKDVFETAIEIGVDLFQGFYLGKPQKEPKLEQFFN